MKYTIKNVRTHIWNENTYEIGLGRKEVLTWQLGSIVLVLMSLAIILGFVGLALFVSVKFLAFSWMGAILVLVTGGALNESRKYTRNPFRLMPYKRDKYDSLIVITGDNETSVIEVLEKLVKYPELEYFTLPDELVEETLLIIDLYKSKKITLEQLREYEKTLENLIAECERRKYKQLLSGKESHDTSAKAALEVAKQVNGDLQ